MVGLMHTFKYKAGYIHDNFTAGIIKVQYKRHIIEVKSVRAAKMLITKLMRRGNLEKNK